MSAQAQQAREALGARLRELRKDARLTGRALAAREGWQLSKVSKIEHGKQQPSEDDIRAWCRHCAAEHELADLLATVRAVEAMWMEWQRTLQSGTGRRQQTSIRLHEQTRLFRVYEPSVIWGSVQTAEYAATLFARAVAFYGIPNDVEQGVAARMQRQQLLRQGDRRYSVILGEQALYTDIGGPGVMRAQLERLLTDMSLARLSLGILPFAGPRELWPGESFIMFDERSVMVETFSAEMTITQPREIAVYARTFAALQRSAIYGETARERIVAAAQHHQLQQT